MSAHYQVIVGNIGTVYDGNSESDASAAFDEYAKQSREGYGRAANELVAMLRDDEPIKEQEPMLNVLSIDAWRDGSSWTWNSWRKVGTISKSDFESLNGSRAILKWFRENGFTTDYSKGRASIDDDGYNIVVCERSNGMPCFAIEYGSAY